MSSIFSIFFLIKLLKPSDGEELVEFQENFTSLSILKSSSESIFVKI